MAGQEKKKPGRKPKAKVEATKAEEKIVQSEDQAIIQPEPTTESVYADVAEAVVMDSAPMQEETQAEEPQDERDQIIANLTKMVEDLKAEVYSRRPQVVQVMADTERVVMRFQAEVADDNLTVFGQDGMYGQVTGKTGTVTVPKSEWSRFYNESVRNMIARRWLIVLTGMDEAERDLYGCNYRRGELLDEMAFHKLLDLGRDIAAIFPALCEEHQAMVASRFISAYGEGDERAADRELVVALNEMSKETYRNMPLDKTDSRRKGLFYPIIEDLNEKDASE